MIHHQDFAVVIDQWLQHIRICVPNLVTDVDGAAADSPQQAVLNGILMLCPEHIPVTIIQLIMIHRIVSILQ